MNRWLARSVAGRACGSRRVVRGPLRRLAEQGRGRVFYSSRPGI